jgi:hypothetical protein
MGVHGVFRAEIAIISMSKRAMVPDRDGLGQQYENKWVMPSRELDRPWAPLHYGI